MKERHYCIKDEIKMAMTYDTSDRVDSILVTYCLSSDLSS